MNIKMLCGSFLGLDLNKQVSKFKFCCFKMTQVMLSPSDFIGDTWPRASQYLHHFFCLFILFMLHFFYLVKKNQNSYPYQVFPIYFRRVFSSPSLSEWNMSLRWTRLKISSTTRLFTELISVEVSNIINLISSRDFRWNVR